MTATLAAADMPRTPEEHIPGGRSRPELIALTVLVVGTGVLYLWDLGASGYANVYYAGAVQAMTQSWEAFFFGSLDAGNVVTVDKPPASLWAMAISARIFGFSSWSMLVPQALMGVGTVALLYAAVRRVSGWAPALLAGTVMALTPVAVLMFRFNNPDALLVLLVVAAAYATVRAIETAGTHWLLLAGVFIGFAFLAKMAQGFVVLPALVLAYLMAAPTGFWRRVRQLLGAAAAVVVSAGWWVAVAELWPVGSRPYIGGSQNNSVLELALGYNGLSRIFGRTGGASGGLPSGGLPAGGIPSAGMPGAGSGFGGEAGLTRMFNSEIGGQVSWLLPAALTLLVVGLWTTRRAPRTDRIRASLILWGTWTVVTALVFSLAGGIFHAYYTVALAPGIAALVGIGGWELWRHRTSGAGRAMLALVVAGTGTWAWLLLGRSPDLPWLRWIVVAVAALAALALLGGAAGWRWGTALAIAAVLTGLAGPTAYAVQTAATPHTGSIPLAGPSTGTPPFSGPGGPGGVGATADPAVVALLRSAGTPWSSATIGAMSGAPLALASDTAVMNIGGFMGSDPAPTLEQFQGHVATGQVRYFVEGSSVGPGRGGTLDVDQLIAQAPAAVREDPRFAEFLEMAEAGELPVGPGGGGTGSVITTWVQENFAATTVGGRTVYDLGRPLR